MSDGSRNNERLNSPHANIGAQELMRVGTATYSGFLRKRGKLERIVTSNGFLAVIFSGIAKWRQRFVILSRGCLYVFLDEQASRPMASVSLKGYISVKRYDPDENSEIERRSFELVPSNDNLKTFIFGCAKDGERKVWMQKVREEMLLAHNASSNSNATDIDDYGFLEKPLISNTEGAPIRSKKPLPNLPGDDDEDEDEDEDDYDRISTVSPLPNRPLPELPGQNDQPAIKPTKSKPAVAKKPLLKKQVSRADEYVFKSSDREKAVQILISKPEGTFLVRDGRTDNSKVLSVQTDEGVKEYKVFTEEDHVSLDKNAKFQTIDELLEHYKKECLPRRTLSLSRGYSVTSDY